jgi:uncharacterized protein
MLRKRIAEVPLAGQRMHEVELPLSESFPVIIQRITNMADQDRDFVEYVVKQIVNNPDAVKVDRKIDEMGVLISLDVAPEDMGMVIGREGATAKALRTLLRVIGAKNNARVNLKINEPEGSERKPREQRSIDEVVGGIEV